MLNLPLMINDVVLKVTIKLKNMEVKKDRLDSRTKDIRESDVIIDKIHLKEYEDNDNIVLQPKALTNFIRKNINYSDEMIRFIEVNTKKYKNSDFYDTYLIPIPSYKQNDINDYIYGMLVNNIRFSNPEQIKKTDLSLSKLGFDELFNGEFCNKALTLKNANSNSLYIRNNLINMGFEEQLEVLDFFNGLDCEVSQNTDVILLSEFDIIKDFFKDSRKTNSFLTKYKETAMNNYESYMNLATINHLVNSKNLDWPILSLEQQKILIKKMDSSKRVA